MPVRLFNPKAGLNVDDKFHYIADIINPGYDLRTSAAPIGSKYIKNDINPIIYFKKEAGAGLDKWAILDSEYKPSVKNSVVGKVLVDRINLMEGSLFKWDLIVSLYSDQTRKKYIEINALVDKTDLLDAVNINHNDYNIIDLGEPLDVTYSLELIKINNDQFIELYIHTNNIVKVYCYTSYYGHINKPKIVIDSKTLVSEISSYNYLAPIENQILINYNFVHNIKIPKNFENSRAIALSPPLNEMEFLIFKITNNVETQIGFFRFLSNESVASFGICNEINLTTNDGLIVRSPNYEDPALMNMAISIHFIYN